MNDTIPPGSLSDVPWPTSDQRMRVPDTSMLPGSEKAPPAVVKLLNNAVQGAHDTIDHLATSAAPAARHLAESVAATQGALQAKAEQWRGTGDEWVEGARATVRRNPLVSVALALALGAVVARWTNGR